MTIHLIKMLNKVCAPQVATLRYLSAILLLWAAAMTVQAQSPVVAASEKVELDRYLGVWYEIARKPTHLEKKCARDVTASYTLNEYSNMLIEHRCFDENNQPIKLLGEGYAVNEPWYSKFKLSFLPETIRWLPIAQHDYWILKFDPDYQMVLVGAPDRRHLWVLARQSHPDPELLKLYLAHAKSLGYDLKNLIYTPHQTSP